jgi:uncharacterized repeat protein (TIGR02543 family)
VNDLDLLVVGGGGGGTRGRCAYSWGPGGGGGGVAELLNFSVTSASSVTVKVGSGGTGSANCDTTTQGTSGGQSSVAVAADSLSVVANGGTSPYTGTGMTSAPGGVSGSTIVNGTTTAGKSGGSVTWDGSGNCSWYGCNAGGGGGAGGAGNGLNAGTGVLSTLTNSKFGGGGAGRTDSTFGTADSNAGKSASVCSAAANSGAGGADCGSYAGNGGSGYVYLRYLPGPTSTSTGNQTISIGQTASFSVTATKTSTLTTASFSYQWQKSTNGGTSWSDIPGATAATYSTGNQSSLSNNGARYRAKITQTGTTGSVAPTSFSYSSPAALTVTAEPLLSYNFSDINTFDSSAGNAIGDLSTSGTYDGLLRAGSNSSSASYEPALGALSFPGGANTSGPYATIESGISSSTFAANGMTFDFEANFGAQADYWERLIELGDGNGNTIMVQRQDSTAILQVEIYNDGVSQGYCSLANAIPTTGNAMARWTISLDGSVCKIWKNAASSPEASVSYSGKPLTGKTWTTGYLGKSFWNGASSFEGKLRSMRIYSGVLTPAEIPAFSYKTVTYDSNGQGSASTTAYTSGTVRTPAALSRVGYDFAGWNTQVGGGGTNYSAGATFTPTADTTLYAKWTPKTYTVTYDYNGATNNNLTVSNTYTTGGSVIVLPNPNKYGFVFSGWYKDAAFTNYLNTGGTIYGPSDSSTSITLYAKWTAVNQILNYSASDINSYENSVSTTAINDMSPGGTLDGSLTAGTSNVLPGFDAATGKWTFPGGGHFASPFALVSNSISTTTFNTNGITIDFEADFGSADNSWERLIDFGSAAPPTISNNLFVGRYGISDDLIIDVTSGSTSLGQCRAEGIIDELAVMARYTLTLDGSTCRIWKNGAPQTVTASSGGNTMLPPTGASWTSNFIGKSHWTADENLEGSIKSLRIFSGALTPDQVGPLTYKTVTFGLNGGTSTQPSAGYTSGALRLPAAATRAGYTFTGWNTQADGNGTSRTAAASYSPSASETLYAAWTANTYTVTYDYNGANNNNLTVSNSFTSGGNAIVLPNPTKTGYRFAGWYSDSGLNTSVGTGTYSPTGATTAITLYAKWVLATLVLSYNLSDTTSYVYGGGASINDLSSGGTFDATLNAGSGGASATYSDANGSLLFAGGATNSGPYVSLPSITSAQFASSGMTLDFEADFGAVADSWESLVNLSVSGGNGNVLYVGRRGTGSEIIFEVYNGSSSAGFCSYAGIPTSGHTTNRWTFSIDGTTCRIWKDGTLVSSAAMSAKPLSGLTWASNYIARSNTSTASFEGAVRSLRIFAGAYTPDEIGAFNYKTISYDTNAGSSVIASTRYTSGSVKLPAGPTRSGYTFTGWYSSSAASTLVGAVGATYTPSTDTTLYAGWAATTYTVTFKANDGLSTADITQTVTDGVSVALRSNTFTKSNSTFMGWNTAANGSGTSYSNAQSITPSANLTLYAIWEPNATITFDSNGGSTVATVSHVPYAAIPSNYVGLAKPSNPTKSGKLFGGWSVTETANNGDVANIISWPREYESSGSSETLYAVWLDACSVTSTSFTGTGTTDISSATYGETGKKYLRYRFNTVGTCGWVVPDEVSKVDAVVVGGGGGGSYGNRAGGGGAGSLMVTNLSGHAVTAGLVVPIQIGSGGAHDVISGLGANGNPSIFDYVFANGGGAGAGGQTSRQIAAAGGSGGGGANACAATGTAGGSSLRTISGWSGFANVGGNGKAVTCDTAGGAGGGGAGGVGQNSGNGGASLTRFGIELAGGGGGWIGGSAFKSGGGTVGGDWTGTGCTATIASTSNNAVANTGSGGGACGDGAAGTIVLQFIAPTYTATYSYDSATGGNSVTSADYTMASVALTLPSPTKTGYVFDGWYSDAGLTTLVGAAGASYSPSADITLYAKWSTAPNQTVVFDANGGSGSMTSQVANVATNLMANTFTRSGYTFAGWATAANGSGTQYADQASYPFTSGTTLYAKWSAIPNKTVTFDANDGTGTPATSTQAANVATNLTANAFTRSGYTFTGWNTAANGSGTAYANQATYSFAADTRLYAQWTAVNYSITYNSGSHNSGSVPTDSANYNIGNSVAILGNSGTLARTGYTFAGWTVASDGSGTVLVSGSTLTMGSANINVYAKWTANTYTISYNTNGATGSPADATASYTTAGTAVTLSAVGTMAKAGHTFNGWATTASGTPIAGTYTTTANVTLYAQWSINTISVTYDKGIASSATFNTFPGSAQTGNYGTRVNLNATVDLSVTIGSDVYQFFGWNDGNTIYAAGTSYLLDSNVTMTAVWVQVFAVRYSFNGGTAALNTSAVDVECLVAGNRCTDQQVITLHAAPSRTGYTFAGWNDQNGTNFAAGSSLTVTSSSYLLYAQWTPVSYTVTYAGNGGTTANTQANQNIGDRFTVGAAANRTGYDFSGWSDGTNTYAAGATYVVGSSNVTLTAQWTPKVYTVTYDWNGGSGSAVADANYTVGTTGITLPGITDQVKDGYTFGGWSTTNGGVAISSPFVPTGNTTLFAVWGTGSYVITYAPELGTVSTSTVNVANGNSINLETPTRQGFVFDGWFTAQTGGTRVGGGNSQFTPAASRTLHARWTQASIYGIPVGNLSRLGSINASNSANSTYSGSNGNSSVAVNVPSGALPAGTAVNIDMISDNSHASGLINGDKTFILSVAVSWLAGDGTVPDTASGKAISVTLNNADIKAGALIYSIQGTSVVLLGTATQDGTVTFQLTQDPGIYVVATSPSAPQNPTSSVTSSSATITWQAPSSDGGDAITGYTVTLNNNATCTTTGALSCTINGLSAGTTYTYTVSATNSVGTSPTASGSFSIAANQTVTFNANGGSGTMSSQAANTSTALTANTFSRTGYSFTGWNTAANGSGTAYSDGSTYAFSAGTTLYAQWSGSTYTVTYDYNSATVQNGPSSSGFTSGGTAISLPSPTKTGFSFDGWYTDSGFSTLLGAGGYSYSPTSSVTLYAKFTALPNQTVIFDANGGTGTMSNQVTNAATALTTNTFTQTGYTFAGWNTAANGSGTAYADGATFAFTAGATLYAQWTLIPVTPPAPTPVTPPAPQVERPDAPTNVTATANGDSITVSWSAPTFTGGSAIVDYRVTSSSGMACITTATSCTFNGVNKDVSYSFTVTANNGTRVSNASSASNTVLIPSQLINQRSLTVSGSQSARGAAVKVVVTGGSTAGPIIFEVANGTATGCAIDGEGLLTATTSGTCVVTATMLGDFIYKPVSASTTITFLRALVAQTPLVVSASGTTTVALSTTGGSGSGAVSYSVTSGSTACVLSGNLLTVAKTGTCLVTATKAADDVYEATTSATITVSVAAAKPAVVTPAPVVKVPPIKHVVAVAPSGKPVLVGIQIVKPVIFGPDSAKLDAGDLKQLRAAATLAKSKNMDVLVTGFVKSAGKTTLFEKLLASSRAKTVATYLRKLGVNVAIQYAGYGAYNKLAPSSSDRRVEIRWVAND